MPRPSTSSSRVLLLPQRLGLPATPVQRQHVEGTQALAVPVLDGERIELADDLAVTAGAQVGVDARLERCARVARSAG